MDSAFFYKLLTICVLIRRISTDIHVVVTLKQCGSTIVLDSKETVYLEYKGADIGDYFSPCVIYFINSGDDDMICISTDNSHYFSTNIDCLMTLKYYIGNYPSSLSEEYSCTDFRPLCNRNSRSAVVYRTFGPDNSTSFRVWLYTQNYIPTTAAPTTTWSSWSSWSSGSYDDDKDSSGSVTGIAIGVTVGIIAIVGMVILCGRACSQRSTPKPQYATPVVQYYPQTQPGDQYTNQPQYPNTQPFPPVVTGSQVQNQDTTNAPQFPGYQVHAGVYQVPEQSMQAGNQPEYIPPIQPSAPSNKDIDAPPPPYPGY